MGSNSNKLKPTSTLPPKSTTSLLLLLLTTFQALCSTILASDSIIKSSPPLTTLTHPVVILISSDGFRFGFQFKSATPNIHRLINSGTEAENGLIPVFPTATFPNHYSIATGLFPASHGIINNYFYDPISNDTFTTANHDLKFWVGEPLWETVVNNGYQASTYFWAGSEVKRGKWTCPEYYCKAYDESMPFEDRVDTVLGYFDTQHSEDIPAFMNLYFHYPDYQGHLVGPDDVEVTQAIDKVDSMIGRLIDGLEKRGLFDKVHIILVGDHGMVSTCDKKMIFLEDLANWIEIPSDWVEFDGAVVGIRPPTGHNPSEVVEKMNEGLKQVQNGKHLKVYLKQDLPSRLHYGGTVRIPPIIGMVDEGFYATHTRPNTTEICGGSMEEYCGGTHGYDNAYFSMRSMFIGHGPRFGKGKKVESFMNVEIYNLVISILNIKGSSNNGTDGFPGKVLSSPLASS